jgi:hypothetical protein
VNSYEFFSWHRVLLPSKSIAVMLFRLSPQSVLKPRLPCSCLPGMFAETQTPSGGTRRTVTCNIAIVPPRGKAFICCSAQVVRVATARYYQNPSAAKRRMQVVVIYINTMGSSCPSSACMSVFSRPLRGDRCRR